jgi:putative transposase
VRGKPTLTLADFDTRFRAFLLDVYHRRENAETKAPPVERWEANGFLPRMPDSLEQLDLLLIQVAKARQVRADGIHFQSLRYISTTLAAYVGETVTLRFDPRDMGEIRVFHEDRFLCRAVCAELAGSRFQMQKWTAFFAETPTGYSAHVPDLPGCVAAGVTWTKPGS